MSDSKQVSVEEAADCTPELFELVEYVRDISLDKREKLAREILTEAAALLRKMGPLVEAAKRIQRGCSCRYDDRCGNCQAVVDLQQALEEFNQWATANK